MEQENKIKEIIDKLRPFLIGDGGNIEFVKYEDNIVYLIVPSWPVTDADALISSGLKG